MPIAIVSIFATSCYFKSFCCFRFFCVRKPLEELQELSSTDIGCLWKIQKTKVVDKYLPQPLKNSNCFSSVRKCSKRSWSQHEVDNMFQMATSLLPSSSFTLHREGRRKNIKIISATKIPPYITETFKNSEESSFIKSLDLKVSLSTNCCKKLLESLKEESVLAGLCCEQGTEEWKKKRRNRITGSTCYSIFTFKKQDWTKMLANFFNPVSVVTKEMRHGIEQESCALQAFAKMNPDLEIKNVGILVCQKYPWFAFSPDGIIFEKKKPSRLLEIKCPYLGQFKTGPEVIQTLQYLNEDCSLKRKHSYYAQIQLGMALLNLNKCEFIIYFSKEKNYLQISVPFDRNFAKELMETVSQKYIDNMIHYVCD